MPTAFANRLISLREGRGMSRADLATRLKISTQAVSRWESGTAYPDFERISELADIMGIDPGRLFRDEPPEPTYCSPESIMWPGQVDTALRLLLSQIGHNIRSAREALGLTVELAADRCHYEGIPRDALVMLWPKYETGESIPNPVVLIRFCFFFGVTMEWICRGMVRSRLSDQVLFPLLSSSPDLITRDMNYQREVLNGNI